MSCSTFLERCNPSCFKFGDLNSDHLMRIFAGKPISFLLLFLVCFSSAVFFTTKILRMGNTVAKDPRTIFDFEVDGIDDQKVSLSKYRGKKAYVIVNTAST